MPHTIPAPVLYPVPAVRRIVHFIRSKWHAGNGENYKSMA